MWLATAAGLALGCWCLPALGITVPVAACQSARLVRATEKPYRVHGWTGIVVNGLIVLAWPVMFIWWITFDNANR